MRQHARDLLNPEKQEAAAKRLERFLEGGGTIQKWLDIPEKELETLLREGIRLYEEKHFGYARRIFAFLTLLAPNCPQYWRLLGSAQVKERNWEGALASFKMYASLVEDNSQAKKWIACCQKLLRRQGDQKHG